MYTTWVSHECHMGIILGERTSTVEVRLCGRLQNNSNGKMEAELLAEVNHDTVVGITCTSHGGGGPPVKVWLCVGVQN